jgi:polysaccharide chain length determinant protein (PEP-CTERM system associated)
VIKEFNLYPEWRNAMPMEDVVLRMGGDITIKPETKVSFRISYVNEDPNIAQKVTERLSALFIDENVRDREMVAADTNSFLDSQLESAKRQLIEHEKKLEEYRLRYGNELPSQAPTNLQAMQNAQTQLQTITDASDRARERRLLLERQLDNLDSEPTAADPGPGTTEQQLAAAREQLQALLGRAKPDHPDVKAMQRTIRDLEAKAAAEAAQPPAKPAATRPKAADLARQQRRRDITEQIQDLDRQLEARQKQEATLRSTIGAYEAKLDAVPKRESELVELTRDYATLQNMYQSLLSKRQDAKIATNLERRQIGPQFRVLDPAKVPERPFSPNRMLINLGGGAIGLLLAVAIIGLAEYRDTSFKQEEEVERLLNIRVFALVPDMVSPAEIRARRRRVVAAGIAAAVLAGVVVFLWTGRMPLPF